MRAAILALLLLGACGDNLENKTHDAGVGSDTLPIDAPIDTPAAALTGCLPSTTGIDRPPTGALACDFVPPGVTLGVQP